MAAVDTEEVNERTCKLMRILAIAYRTLECARQTADEWGWDTSELYEAREKIAKYMINTIFDDEEVEK